MKKLPFETDAFRAFAVARLENGLGQGKGTAAVDFKGLLEEVFKKESGEMSDGLEGEVGGDVAGAGAEPRTRKSGDEVGLDTSHLRDAD